MAEELAPNLDLVLDFRFMEIEAELSVIIEHAEAIERQLPVIIEAERKRLEEELTGADYDERYGMMQWIDEFADEVLPRLYRSPILVELWAVFESTIIEIGKYLKQQAGHSLSVDDLRGSNDFERAQKYYAHVLHFPLIEIADMKEQLEMLLLVRNAIAHSNARLEVIKPARLEKIYHWEKVRGGITTSANYLNFSAEFVEDMAKAVKTSVEDLIRRVKAKH